MNPYDCHQSGTTTAAVAVCRHGGVSLCPDPVKVTVEHLARPEGMGLAVLRETGRRLPCLTCCDAEHQF